MIGDYLCKSAFAEGDLSSSVSMTSARSRLMMVSLQPSNLSTSAGFAMKMKTLKFTNGASGSTLYEVLLMCGAQADESRYQWSIDIPMGEDGILFDTGISVIEGSTTGDSGSPCCVDALTIFYV